MKKIASLMNSQENIKMCINSFWKMPYPSISTFLLSALLHLSCTLNTYTTSGAAGWSGFHTSSDSSSCKSWAENEASQ